MVNRSTSGPDTPDWDALARYLAGEANADETATVDRWLAADPRRRDFVEAVDGLLTPSRVAPPADVDVDAALAAVRRRLDHAIVHPIGGRSRPDLPLAGRRNFFLRAAAVLAVVAGAAGLFSLATRDDAAPGLAARVHRTAVAEFDTLFLPDGTRAILGPGTRLVLADGYGEDDRAVDLDGEAMFDVVHDDRLPFLVRFRGGVAVDLGTSFSVRTAPAGGARVAVTDGAVRLRRDDDPEQAGVVLREGDRGRLPPTGPPTAERGVVTAEDIAWTGGVLTFRDAPMPEVASDLRRWFGYELRVADASLADRHLTATFRDEPPAQIASVIALALGAAAEVAGDTIVIRETDGVR